jgi:hypothetical protein
MKTLKFCLIFLSLCRFASAEGSANVSGTSLKLGRGARPTALGGAYMALANDAESILWNPAGLTALRDIQVTASHLSYFGGVNDEFLAFAQPIYSMGAAWGLGTTYLYTDDVARDNWGNRGDTFTDFDFSMQVAYAMDFLKYFSGGFTYSLLRQGYAGNFSMGSAFDLGFQTRRLMDNRLSLGLGALNLGTPMAIGDAVNNLPITFKGGAAWWVTPGWVLAAEYSHQPIDFINRWHAGTEYTWEQDRMKVSLRAGYSLGPEADQGSLAGLTGGLGVGLGSYQVDYSFVPAGDLGASHRFTLTYSFGNY